MVAAGDGRAVRTVVRLLAALLLAATAACGGGSGSGAARSSSPAAGPPYAVSTRVVADATTRVVQVWAPTGRGRWPVVYALPGISGHKADFDQLGPALARRGVVVFATDYDPAGTADEVFRAIECGYRYARKVAPGYGGDLTRPVTAVGYSAGARFAGALVAPMFGPAGTYDACFTGAPVPDVLVGINGCYFAYKNLTFSFSTDLGSRSVRLLLVTGQADDQCATWQSQKAAKALKDAGFDTTLVSIPGANHYTPMFHDLDHGKVTTVAHDPAGDTTVRAILDAIGAAK
ncbi:MAG: alpha/beta hydrolase [Blastococcus sp.]